jgi:diguanylate cyclase (GGDEF)-like protein
VGGPAPKRAAATTIVRLSMSCPGASTVVKTITPRLAASLRAEKTSPLTLMPKPTLEHILACPNLPSLPTVAMEVLELTRNANVQLTEIACVVQNDPALCAKILKTVNSSFYGLSKPCPTITRALTYLGLSTVKSLVLGFSLVDCTKVSEDGFDMIDYWRRCVYSAAAARRIAAMRNTCDPEEAFIAALMQDLGMPAIFQAIGREYVDVVASTAGSHESLAEAERDELGFDHATVGAALAERWRLPTEMVQAIRYHHSPANEAPLSRTVCLAFCAANTLSRSEAGASLSLFTNRAVEWFGLSRDEAGAKLGVIAEDARELARLFKINTGQAPDINAILAQAEDASLVHQISVAREAETLRQTASDLARAAATDALTQCFNRKHFDAELSTRFEDAQSMNGCLAVIMVDADKFKNLNDTHGHQVGDAVLIEVARRLRETVGDAGVVCRYGGEEFSAILPGATRKDAAMKAESMRLAISSAPVDVKSLHGPVDSVSVTTSLGVAVLEPSAAARITTPQLLVQAADKALYAAKHAGRNCVRVFHLKPTIAIAAT